MDVGRPAGRPPAGVVVENLVKRYKKNPVPAVDGVSFTVERGEIFGLLGPNGAGKTTTIGVLTTRVRPDAGRAFVGGIDVVADPVAAKTRLAVVPQRNNLDRSLTIRQNLLFHAAYHGVPPAQRQQRATVLLEQFGLAERANDRVDLFSGGQMQRVMIARALMHSPEVLFLDEPSTGLDPAARLFVWDRIRELRHAGVTIVLTTHAMDEAAELADRIAIMDHGHILVMDTPDGLTRELPGGESLDVTIAVPAPATVAHLIEVLRGVAGVVRAEVVTKAQPRGPGGPGGPSGPARGPGRPGRGNGSGFGGGPMGGVAEAGGGDGLSEDGLRLRLYLSADAAPMVSRLAQVLTEHGAQLVDFRLGHPSLEDVFLHLTGRLLR